HGGYAGVTVGVGLAGQTRHRRVHRPRADGIDPDPVSDVLLGRRTGESADRRFRGGVGAQHRERQVGADGRGDVDDHSTAVGPHVTDLVRHAQPRAGEVGRYQPVPRPLATATNAGRPSAGPSSMAVLMRPATTPACANSASAAEAVADENVMATPVGTRANPGRTDPQWGESGLSLPRAASPPAATTHPTAASADRLALATRRAVAEPATD